MEEKIIGQRVARNSLKMMIGLCVFVIVLGLIFVVVPAMEIIPFYMLYMGLFFVVGGAVGIAISVVDDKKKKKVAHLPTIVQVDETTVKCFLKNGEEVLVDLRDVKDIIFTARETSGVVSIVYTDGCIVFKFKDKQRKRVYVDQVAEGQDVVNILNKIKNNCSPSVTL